MTTPPCSPGVTTLGNCPGYLRICATPGALVAGAVQLRNKDTGLPMNWPVGTTAWLAITSGSFAAEYPALVDNAYLRFQVAGTDTIQWPRAATAAIWIQYPDQPAPIEWVRGDIERGCC